MQTQFVSKGRVTTSIHFYILGFNTLRKNIFAIIMIIFRHTAVDLLDPSNEDVCQTSKKHKGWVVYCHLIYSFPWKPGVFYHFCALFFISSSLYIILHYIISYSLVVSKIENVKAPVAPGIHETAKLKIRNLQLFTLDALGWCFVWILCNSDWS